MIRNQRGFTMIEMMVVIMIGAALTSITISAFSGVQRAMAQRGAQRVVQSMHERARMMAIEAGQIVEFHVDQTGDSIWVERNDTIIDRVLIRDEFDMDVGASQSHMYICFNSRGFAQSGCTSFTSLSLIWFQRPGSADTDRRYLFWTTGGALVEENGTG